MLLFLWHFGRHVLQEIFQRDLTTKRNLILREDLLLFFIICDSEWRNFGFWAVVWTKEAPWRRYSGLWAAVMNSFYIFGALHRFKDYWPPPSVIRLQGPCNYTAIKNMLKKQVWIFISLVQSSKPVIEVTRQHEQEHSTKSVHGSCCIRTKSCDPQKCRRVVQWCECHLINVTGPTRRVTSSGVLYSSLNPWVAVDH